MKPPGASPLSSEGPGIPLAHGGLSPWSPSSWRAGKSAPAPPQTAVLGQVYRRGQPSCVTHLLPTVWGKGPTTRCAHKSTTF